MTPKFKKGDKVKIVKFVMSSLANNNVGRIITINSYSGDNNNHLGRYYATSICPSDGGGIYESEMELVRNNPNCKGIRI